MALVFNDEQTELKDTARAFVDDKAPVAALRKLRDGKDATGFDRALWKEMADLGWAGVTFPEAYGGSAFGWMGLGGIMVEMGRTLVASPMMSTVILCGSAILMGGSDAQKEDLLPRIAAGDLIMALALEEGPHHNPFGVAATAIKTATGYEISGSKTFVLDGHAADRLIVAARTAGKPGDKAGISLFLVDGNAAGVTRTRTMMVDSRNAANITFDKVAVSAKDLVGPLDGGGDLLDGVLDRARILLAAEMLGSMDEIYGITVQYLKDRDQFGVKIGTFQALKHRAADMFAEIELARSAVMDGLAALDAGRNDVAVAASLAKAKACDVFLTVSNEAVQMHGGIGMTDEVRRRAIEPFYTTKGVGKGTGLGLSMVHGFVAQLGGALRVHSAPGQGTRVEMWLPQAAGPASAMLDAVAPAAAPRRHATLLLVDDDELVRSGTAAMLGDLGYRVIEAAGGAPALDLLRSDAPVDALVTDFLMHGMTGGDLLAAARQTRPGLPVLVVTGYADTASLDLPAPILPKPYGAAELAAAVAALFEPAAA